jgi:5'(3')-deoxyribonucleotidase
MEKPKIGIDIDGVLADFNSSFVKLVKTEIGITLPNIPYSWDYAGDFLTKQQIYRVWDKIKKGTFWSSLEPLGNIERFLSRFYAMYDLYFITNRPGYGAKSETEWWLNQYGRISFPTVLTVEDKKDKAAIIKALRIYAYIDDNFETCEATSRVTNTFLLDAPYNRLGEIEGVKRIKDRMEFADYVFNKVQAPQSDV